MGPKLRNTATRDQHRRAIARTRPPCGICGDPIDYAIPYRADDGTVNLDAYVVDHVIPLNRGGPDTLENKTAAHARCNRAKSDNLPELPEPTSGLTHRRWW